MMTMTMPMILMVTTRFELNRETNLISKLTEANTYTHQTEQKPFNSSSFFAVFACLLSLFFFCCCRNAIG